MGVKHFFPWFRESFSDCITTCNKKNKIGESVDIDNLAIDLNGIFHPCAQKTYNYGSHKRMLQRKPTTKLQFEMFQKVAEQIEYYRDTIKPRKRLILCIDGVAGAAKMSQQRQRRFKNGASNKENCFDPNCISPGTKMMDYLSKYIDWYIRVMKNNSPEWKNLEIIFSNEKSPGEGEHKIISFMRKNNTKYESYCIQGMDADLIMLSLGAGLENIFIFREDSFNPNLYHFIDIGKSRGGIIDKMKWEGKSQFRKKNSIDDFIFLCFLLGNDFLPQIPTLEIFQGGLEIILEVYRNVCGEYGHLTRVNKNENLVFRTKGLKVFFGTLAQYEKGAIEEKYNKGGSFFKDELIDKYLTQIDENYTLNLKDYKEEYYKTKFKNTTTDDICKRYLDGMQWVLTYYKRGIPDWDWYFPFYYAPFCSDLVKAVENFKPVEYKETQPAKPFLQLLYVLPPQSSALLPDPLNKILTDEKSPLKKYCPEKLEIDLSGKKREWEGIALLPFVDFDLTKEIYKNNEPKIDRIEAKRNIIGKSFKYIVENKEFEYNFKSFYGNIPQCRIRTEIIDF